MHPDWNRRIEMIKSHLALQGFEVEMNSSCFAPTSLTVNRKRFFIETRSLDAGATLYVFDKLRGKTNRATVSVTDSGKVFVTPEFARLVNG